MFHINGGRQMEMNNEMVTQVEDNEVVQQVRNVGAQVAVPITETDVVPLNYQNALASYTEAEQQEILTLAERIDVREIENVLNYGSVPLRKTFEQCGNFLKNERGSYADQEVIKRVVELSKKACSSNDDFNLALQGPNALQKFLMKLANGSKANSRTEKLQKSAVTNYKLLTELKASCDSWLEMLKDAMGDIEDSAMSDAETIDLLEKYLIAGHLADERTALEMKDIKAQYQETGLQKYSHEYQKLEEGYQVFQKKMVDLEKSRVMYYLSLGQLALIRKGNRNVQMSIHEQVDHSMALVGQQLRNALLNAKTQEVLEGQHAIVRLSDELIKDISQSIGLTTEETEKALYASFYHTEAAKTAITAVVNSCEEIKKIADEMLPQMKADLSELSGLIEQLEPVVGTSIETLKEEKGVATTGATGLNF